MKESELRQHATCSLCSRKIGHTGVPLFWTATVTRFGLDAQAIQRQIGLGMMLSPALAGVMGPDEDMAKPVMDPVTITVCESCATMKSLPLAAMVTP